MTTTAPTSYAAGSPEEAQAKAKDKVIAKALFAPKSYTEAHLETAMCLWEAALELRGRIDHKKETGLTDWSDAEANLDRWLDEEGTSAVRHGIISWVDECEAAWERDRELGVEHEPYDWEHCPRFIQKKLEELY